MNRTVRLAERPTGLPDAATWAIADEAMPEPGPGELLVRVDQISLDPAMRGWINAARSYIEPVAVGGVMRAGAIGEVLKSNAPAFAPGDLVYGPFGVQQFAVAATDSKIHSDVIYKIDTGLAPASNWLSILGLPGMTAYFGLLDVGALKDGETVVVSAAAGGVGALVGQIAKLKGCHVVGIAGGPDKCRFVTEELGFDACVDYKADGLYKALQAALGESGGKPRRIDIYFDNVGGPILETCMSLLGMRARVVICGAIVGYNDPSKIQGPRTYLNLLVSRARMEGFVVFDYAARYQEAQAAIGGWLRAGKVRALEDIREGIDEFPAALNDLYSGGNFGKLILRP